MEALMSEQVLEQENLEFAGSGGRSQENVDEGFRPAFLDLETLTVYPSRFADGTPAPIHLLDGLPCEVVVRRTETGRVQAIKGSVVSGFTLKGVFYTREAAAMRRRKSD